LIIDRFLEIYARYMLYFSEYKAKHPEPSHPLEERSLKKGEELRLKHQQAIFTARL
jgi:hypothetical protein